MVILLWLFSFFYLVNNGLSSMLHTTIPPDSWTGRWLPERTTRKPNSAELANLFPSGTKAKGSKDSCDDGEINLEVDLRDNADRTECLHPRLRIIPDYSRQSILEFENIPRAYSAQHRCMNETIEYLSPLPTFGPHRRIWAAYGEYDYLPPQRWVHNLEHGGIVALFHPCADIYEIKSLKRNVRQCLWKHIITPSPNLDEKRPFALIGWGVRLRMGSVDSAEVREFIQRHALRGPEHTSTDGKFTKNLIHRANLVSDASDSQLCPSPLPHDK